MQHRERVDELRRVSELRTHMGFLVDSLLYYVQVCVLVVKVDVLRQFMVLFDVAEAQMLNIISLLMYAAQSTPPPIHTHTH